MSVQNTFQKISIFRYSSSEKLKISQFFLQNRCSRKVLIWTEKIILRTPVESYTFEVQTKTVFFNVLIKTKPPPKQKFFSAYVVIGCQKTDQSFHSFNVRKQSNFKFLSQNSPSEMSANASTVENSFRKWQKFCGASSFRGRSKRIALDGKKVV